MATDIQTDTPYERAVMGFQKYWYPACGEREVGKHPKRMVLLGEPIAFVRRGERVYAVQDECPHRGARMSLGKNEFPGTDTLACRFHGWTFDLKDGRCVAALTDGPDSPVVGKVRLRTFPVEQREGIVWVWIGRGAPVPLEEDAPTILLEKETVVKFRHRQVYGNWRYHAEGAGGGHFQMLHRDAIGTLFTRYYSYQPDYVIEMGDGSGNGDDHGPWLLEKSGFPIPQSDFGGLGSWPPKRAWRRWGQPFQRLVRGVQSVTSIRLPGYLRVYHFPMNDAMYYEWYVAIDADHYNYFQVSCHWPKNPISRLWTHIWWHLFAGPIRMGRFNDQDKGMVAANTDWEKRQGRHGPAPESYRPDRYPSGWIEHANANARSAR